MSCTSTVKIASTMDFFSDDVWGEEPDWVIDSEIGDDGAGEGFSSDPLGQGGVIGGQHVLMLIDCSPTMFQSFQSNPSLPSRSPTSAMDMSLQVVEDILKKRIRNTITLKTGKRDGVGVLLFNTRKHRQLKRDEEIDGDPKTDAKANRYVGKSEDDDNDEDEDGGDDDDEEDEESEDQADRESAGVVVHELIKLAPPGIKQVKKILSCLDEDVYADMEEDGSGRRRRMRDLKGEFVSSHSLKDDDDMRKLPLQTAIEDAIRTFQEAKCVKKNTKPNEPIDTKSIWIFTNNEDPSPHTKSENLREMVRSVAGDAKEQDISIVLWPLPLASQVDKVREEGKNPSNGDGKGDNEQEEDDDDERNEFPKIAFDYGKFFESIATTIPFQHRLFLLDRDEIDYNLCQMQGYWKKLRPSFRSPLFLPDWREAMDGDSEEESKQLSIMISWYSFIQRQTKPRKVAIDQRTRLETVKTKLWMDENGTVFAKDKLGDATDRSRPKPGKQRIREYAEFGGELIPITLEDKAELTKQANGYRESGGLTLLGFKDKNSIPFYHTLSKAYFVYPDDEIVQGSRRAFIQLHAAMLRKNVVAIGEALMRVQFKSRLAVIIPIEEELEQDGDIENLCLAPGMMVKLLPFEDDLRALEPCAAMMEVVEAGQSQNSGNDILDLDPVLSSTPVKQEQQDSVGGSVASEEAVLAAMNLIRHQQLDQRVIGLDFENAQLARFIDYLEAVALEIPATPGEKDYDIEVDDNEIRAAVGDQIEAFLRVLPEDEVKSARSKQARKRKLEPDDSGIDWERLFLENSIDTCKVDELKKFLKSEGEPVAGRKADLVRRVEQLVAKKTKQGIVKMEE